MSNYRKLFKFFQIKNNTILRHNIEPGISNKPACLAGTEFRSPNTSQILNPYSIFLIQKHWKFLWSFLFLLALPYQISKGCGPYDLKFEGYSFLNPNIVNTDAEYARYFLRFNDLYTSYDSVQLVQQDENLREWNERFCNFFQPIDLGNVIYKASVNEMKSIRNAANDRNTPLPDRFKNSDFADHLRDEKCLEVVDYLIFAKNCEKHAKVGEGWSTPQRDLATMKKLIDEGKTYFYNTQSQYVRLRYAYQIIRLAHYRKDYQAVLDLHEELIPKVHAHASLMDYWIMGHRAGALLKLGNRTEAAYLYSLVFANCPSKRQSAFQSFSIKNNKEWEEVMLMCQSDEERAMLYTIRANEDDSRTVEEMENIYALDPLNENLELLLVKEMTEIEKDLLGIDFNNRKDRNRRYFKLPREDVGKYLIRLKVFVKKCVQEKKVADWNLWRIADGYLTFLAGDYYQANKTFAEIKNNIKTQNKHLVEQLEVIQLALKIAEIDQEINEKDENMIGNIIRENNLYWKYKDFPDYINDKLQDVFQKSGQKGKAFRVHHTLAALKMNPDLEVINDLLEICDKKNKSSLEKVLVKKNNLTTIKNDLLTIKGVALFNEDKIEAALEVFRKVPQPERMAEQFNPFHEHIIDCFDCPMGDTLVYDRVGILEEILRLEYDGRAHLETGASSFYQLGNAYYNMTYFGDSWKVMDFFRSSTNWNYVNPENKYFTPQSELGNVEKMDLSIAKRYYETALELAKNDELAARACFGLAKCYLNEFYLDPETEYFSSDNEIPVLPEKYNFYHLKFLNDYAETEYYRMVIEECQFFKVY